MYHNLIIELQINDLIVLFYNNSYKFLFKTHLTAKTTLSYLI